ncbi:hypothetical protein [Nocardia amamiensis]|nr:hypothetical protein [Nocardia amamiensis]
MLLFIRRYEDAISVVRRTDGRLSIATYPTRQDLPQLVRNRWRNG